MLMLLQALPVLDLALLHHLALSGPTCLKGNPVLQKDWPQGPLFYYAMQKEWYSQIYAPSIFFRGPIGGKFNDKMISSIGNFASNGITEEQRQLYLPVMRALLKVMQTDRPSARDINTLMVETRDLNKKVPKGQNLLGNFANFGIDGLESMGLPEFGDIIENVDGIPHIRTTWGKFISLHLQ